MGKYDIDDELEIDLGEVATTTSSTTNSSHNNNNSSSSNSNKTIHHNGYEYKEITSPHTGKIWLDRNLGASRVAQSFDDEQAYGDYFQRGRDADGHEKKDSSQTDSISSSSKPNHSKFITGSWDNRYDWLKDQDDSLWKDAKNCPCPPGYRLPTIEELKAETTKVGVKNRDDAFNSFLKFPSDGYRCSRSGSLYDRGSHGYVWSSCVDGKDAFCLHFNSYFACSSDYERAYGLSVRCLKA